MKHQAWTLMVSAAFASSFTTPALAADPGFYLTFALGQAEEDPNTIGTNIGIGAPPIAIQHIEPDQVAVDDGGVVWSVAAGYRINPYVAVEVDYMDFGTTDVSEHYTINPGNTLFPPELTRTYSSKVTGPALSLLGSVPIGKEFDVFLRVGVLFADRELKISPSAGLEETFGSTVWLGGAGVSWSFASRWAIRAEYQRTGKLEETFLAGETEMERTSLSMLFRL